MNSNVISIRLDQNHENMLNALIQHYRKQMAATGLNLEVTQSSIIKTAIEQEYKRCIKTKSK